jgi:ribosomal protein S18 acetylase RimI-like enzyme
VVPDAAHRIVELDHAHRAAAVALWHRAGLTRPWNPPDADFDRAVDGATSTVLGAVATDNSLVATVMVGHDGHRGWISYLAVEPVIRRDGMGGTMMHAAERWLAARSVPKVQLMVRTDNDSAHDFYEAIGYERQDVVVLGRWLSEVDES